MTTKYTYHYPTPEELYALEAEARRLRSEAIAEVLRKALTAVKGLFERPAIARNVRHA